MYRNFHQEAANTVLIFSQQQTIANTPNENINDFSNNSFEHAKLQEKQKNFQIEQQLRGNKSRIEEEQISEQLLKLQEQKKQEAENEQKANIQSKLRNQLLANRYAERLRRRIIIDGETKTIGTHDFLLCVKQLQIEGSEVINNQYPAGVVKH